jgi:hypothetical protein
MINESIIDRILGYVSGIILNFKCVLCFKCSTSKVTKRKKKRLLKRKCFVEK